MKLFHGMRQNILFFSLLISIVPLLFVGFIAFSHAKKVTETKVVDQLVSIADLKKKELEGWVSQHMRDLSIHTDDTEVLAIAMNGIPQDHISPQLRYIQKLFQSYGTYIINTEGTIIASINEKDIGITVKEDFIQAPLQFAQPHIDDYLVSNIGLPVIRFAFPISSPVTKVIHGALVVELDLTTNLFTTVNSWPGMGHTGETLIAKRVGKNIRFLNTLRHINQPEEKPNISVDSEMALPAIFASAGEEGVLRTEDYRGVPVLAVYKHIPALNWGFVAKIDQDEAFEPILDLQRTIILLTIGTVFTIIIIAFFVSNTIITPLRKIEDYSRKLATGKTEGSLDIKSGGEIGSLAASIRSMEKDLILYQKELLKSEKLAAIGKLSGSVAHDIRNPLGAINNSIYYLDTFLGQKIQNEKFTKHIGIMRREIDRANEIISDLMDYSRDNTPHLSKTHINPLIESALEGISIPDHISIQKNLSHEIPDMLLDHSQIRRVLGNLIQNSIHALGNGGVIEIRSAAKNDQLTITVADNGEGIAGEHLESIFEPLYTTKSKGVGLGLSIALTFIAKHGGNIDCSSTPGHGTIFTITLPVTREAATE